jgi:hypothetical protein
MKLTSFCNYELVIKISFRWLYDYFILHRYCSDE